MSVSSANTLVMKTNPTPRYPHKILSIQTFELLLPFMELLSCRKWTSCQYLQYRSTTFLRVCKLTFRRFLLTNINVLLPDINILQSLTSLQYDRWQPFCVSSAQVTTENQPNAYPTTVLSCLLAMQYGLDFSYNIEHLAINNLL